MKSIKQSNKGFTLVELCVVMVIFSILASITTMGLISWQEYSQNNKAQENAEIVYMAMRNKMAVLKANGLEDTVNNLTYLSCKKLNNLSKSDYSSYKDKDYLSQVPENDYNILFDYISPFVYDKSILDASISIKFVNGVITEVYYCDRCDKFDNNTGNSDNSCIYLDSIKNDDEARYDYVVGMYIPD